MATRLLVVDHDPGAAQLVQRALNETGFIVHHAYTQQDGLTFLARNAVAGITVGRDLSGEILPERLARIWAFVGRHQSTSGLGSGLAP